MQLRKRFSEGLFKMECLMTLGAYNSLSQWTQWGDKEFYNLHFITSSLINELKIFVFLRWWWWWWWWWEGGWGVGGGESRKMCVPLEKSWLRPWLERKWSIDSLFRLGSSHVVFLISLIHEVKDNISLYKSKKWLSSWTISFGKIRRLRLEKSRDFVES